jgi:type IV pilus assembly protein PilA
MNAAREKALNEVSALLESTNLAAGPVTASEAPWHTKPWAKFLSGSLPWFIISLFTIPGIAKKEKNSLPAFFALQLFTIIFGFVNHLIPSTGRFWIDHILAPWGVFFVCIIIPSSIAAVAAFRKVKDSSQRKAIMNNLRQLAAASDQYYLETGHTQATYEQLVGPEPTKYIKHIHSIDGERYDLIEFKQGQPLLVLRRSGEIVKYEN